MFVFLPVSCQNRINGSVGDNVLLPCAGPKLLPEQVFVLWKDKNDRTVVDIIKSLVKSDTQDPIFEGRVDSFSGAFKDGNFSIVLKNVQESDSGTYSCNFPKLRISDSVQLSVSGLFFRYEYTLLSISIWCL